MPFVVSAFLFLSGILYTYDSAQLNISVAVPDPVLAGQELNFQLMVLNFGDENWQANETSIDIELFDPNKNYVQKISGVKIKETVQKGETALLFVPFKVPLNYSGMYYYLVRVFRMERELFKSDMLNFEVEPVLIPVEKERVVELGGNVIVSNKASFRDYKSTASADTVNYLGNISANVIGKVYDKTVLFNLYTNHTREKNEIYSLLMNLYSETLNIGLGDIQPSFSQLSIYNLSTRGLYLDWAKNMFLTKASVFRLQEKTGNNSSDGNYARYGAGVAQEAELPLSNRIGLAYSVIVDDKESLEDIFKKDPFYSGLTVTPAQNDIATLYWNFSHIKPVVLGFEFSQSRYVSDTSSANPVSISDNAWRATLSYAKPALSLNGNYYLTGPGYWSFANPSVYRDRKGYDVSGLVRPFSFLSVNGMYNVMDDNIDPEKNKTSRVSQKIMSAGTAFAYKTFPSLSLSYSANTQFGEVFSGTGTAAGGGGWAASNLNNEMSVKAVNLSYRRTSWNIGLTYQMIDFSDLTRNTTDYSQNGVSVSYSHRLSSRFSARFGASNNVKSDKDSSLTTSNSASLNLLVSVIPSRLNLNIFSSYGTNLTDRKEGIARKDDMMMNNNIEATFFLNDKINISAGGSYIVYDDMIGLTGYSDTSAILRVNINF